MAQSSKLWEHAMVFAFIVGWEVGKAAVGIRDIIAEGPCIGYESANLIIFWNGLTGILKEQSKHYSSFVR